MKKWPYKKGGLSWGDNFVVFDYFNTSVIWPEKRGGLSKGNNLVVFYYLNTSVIWPEKMVAFGKIGHIRGVASLEGTIL
jgi:hypothetical protein